MKIILRLHLISILMGFTFLSFGLTTLSPGDLIVLTVNSDETFKSAVQNANGFDFVTRIHLDAGTEVYFTDIAWTGTAWRSGGEGIVRYTAPAEWLTAGTIVHYDDTVISGIPTSWAGMWDMYYINSGVLTLSNSNGNSFDPSGSGDNLLVFQGNVSAPSFIYGVGWAKTASWISTGSPDTNNSYLPSTLTLNTTAVNLWNVDNYQYTCSSSDNKDFNSGNFLTYFFDSSHWSSDNNILYGKSTCAIIVDLVAPTVTVEQSLGQNDPTNNDALSYVVTFSEEINPTTFSASDLTLTGTGTGGIIGTPTTVDNIIWTIPVTADTDGTYILSLPANSIKDATWNFNTASSSIDHQITYDSVVPMTPLLAPALLTASDTGVSSTDNIINNLPIDISVVCSEVWSTITLYVDGAPEVTPVSCWALWSITITTEAQLPAPVWTYDKVYAITYVETDTAGNESLSSPSLTITLDSISPTISITDDTQAGPVMSETIRATVQDILGSTMSDIDTTSLLYGFSSDDVCDATDVYTENFSSATDISFTSEIHNGEYICMTARDIAGNTVYSASSEHPLNIDSTPPSFNVASVDSIITPPYSISNTTPSIIFTVAIMDSVTLTNWNCTPTPATGTSVTCTSATILTEWWHTISPTIIDAVGNSVTGNITITIDTTNPLIPTITTPDFSNNNFPIITGLCEVNATVTVTISPTNEVVNVTCIWAGNYSVVSTVKVPFGAYSATTYQRDAAGNVSPIANSNGSIYAYVSGGGTIVLPTINLPVIPKPPIIAVTPPVEKITPEVLSCQGENKVNQWYRFCSVGDTLTSFSHFKDNILCENFITSRETESEYDYEKTVPRKEALWIATKMIRNNSQKNNEAQKNQFTDIGIPGQAEWIMPVVQIGLYYKIISPNRSIFEPEKEVTRAEAYAMIMSAVCLYPTSENENSWQKNIHITAKNAWLTSQDWETFESERYILRQEIFVLASRAADWAEKTGGCAAKNIECLAQ